jgi:TfoX/Sxy family transcriptional regulator of competence genes
VDDSNRGQYEAEGMGGVPPYADKPKPMTTSYYQVPARILEHGDQLTRWARAWVRVAETRDSPQRASLAE